jgi:hypothetical protein
MDDFEAQLKTLPLARPSEDMRRRIFGDKPGGWWFVGVFRRRIPLGWAALFALFAGIAGMFGSQYWKTAPAPPLQRAVHVQIIKAASDRNIFDFTEPAADFMQGDLTGRIEPPKEI